VTALVQSKIGQVSDCFCYSAKIWGGLGPAHGQGQREGNRGRFGWKVGDGDGKFRNIRKAEPNAVKAIRDVDFHKMDWAKPGVTVDEVGNEPFKGPAKLHGLGWGEELRRRVMVDERKAVVDNRSRTAFVLGHHTHGRNTQVGNLAYAVLTEVISSRGAVPSLARSMSACLFCRR